MRLGNKVNNIDVVYTPWSNLKKTPSMDAGQVGFQNSKMVNFFITLIIIIITIFVHVFSSRMDVYLILLFNLGPDCDSGEADK